MQGDSRLFRWLAQVHLASQLGDQTSNLPFTSQAALPPELSQPHEHPETLSSSTGIWVFLTPSIYNLFTLRLKTSSTRQACALMGFSLSGEHNKNSRVMIRLCYVDLETCN